MNNFKFISAIIILVNLLSFQNVMAQDFTVTSPDQNIKIKIINGEQLTWSCTFLNRMITESSALGFEFKNEPAMTGNFNVISTGLNEINEIWNPVVKSKHSEIRNHFNELFLLLKEKESPMREMGITFRAYNDGIAFRYHLLRGAKIVDRQITRELTTFAIPGDPKAWVVEYGGYSTSQESEFKEFPLSYVTDKTIAGMPFLMDYGENCWVTLTEARIDNFPAFYLGTNGKSGQLTTKLVPLPGEPEDGVKARFADEVFSPWRVLMIGNSPGTLIESDIIQNLNDPCAISDPSWIRPGMSAWDHWWSGEVKMEMPVIKQYIDLASEMGWPYMLVDWQWYGKFNTPEADITRWAPQINMPEIIAYAASKNVRIIVWLYSTDVNRNSAYKKAFPLYHQWGVAGVKIDFMDRDDQQMVNWYHDIIRCAADNQLLVNFHGAYKPDGIIRTWPNMITREGVLGGEYYKFSDRMSPEHNVKLAFTRMLAGQMDYTPGGFLNVTREEWKQQVPTLVWNTRAAELSKFVIFESPLTVVCDHPDHILNQPGSDFLKIVPTTWDDIRFLGGYPGDYVAIAKRSGDQWFIGILNNQSGKQITIPVNFLPAGNYELESWSDTKKSDKEPTDIQKKVQKLKFDEPLKITLAKNGGYVGVISKLK
ncbi:MAG: glycoside hydrolase family 97 protein [Prolixibacteraceae bacterium]|nr:glycoside hydrolase family 97 protein [Prolixibacteraceae bacterium]HQE51945.1 glycoside hydrolase family 97 protein [Prolixibacteraceae bacterium]HQH76211.1 glycoside hydrolase family 97 protein [Prolixibacteraceae bacterium]HQJ85526.1 glycoside hydrolase family 97 protein [Prolixibacteraceae bacterium]